MSSLADRMESEDSSTSLLSRRPSEMGSTYMMESGIFMSSFAATIFITALVTVGILFLTLLVALTVMLESCQTTHAGVVEQARESDVYNYCKLFAFHAELNNFEEDETPSICKQPMFQHIYQHRFLQDLNFTVQLAEIYFSALKPDDDGLDVILMDVDDMFLSETTPYTNSGQQRSTLVESLKHITHMTILRLFKKLQASGWHISLFSRKPLKNRNATVDSLKSAGYNEWSSLIMRTDDELHLENWEFISGRRVQLQNQGFRIMSTISSRMDALQGPCLGKRNFKLVSPILYGV
ncbi:uncharacterized protein At2g39920 isoform X1 [Typha angustifolia]|uniref:uncharacterized protein At2g39920 isoform X1 n=1 Tax=Typha angustifolia TaxID=59011 RepID=UPI003C2E0D13